MPGLVPGIQPTASAGASGEMDSGDKRRNDTVAPVRIGTSGGAMNQLQAYWPLYPELLLIGAAMALLMLGVFRPERTAEAEAIGWLAVLVLGLASWFVLQQPPGTHRLFEGAFVVDGFARFMKVLTFVSSAAALILSFDHMRQAGALKFEYPVPGCCRRRAWA
jgi:hypothetical protein